MSFLETIKREWEYTPYDDGDGGYWEKRFGNITVLYCKHDGLQLFFETDCGAYNDDKLFDVVSLVAKLHETEESAHV